MNQEDMQKAYNLLSAINNDLLLENARLKQSLEALSLRRSLWYRIKRAVDMLRGKSNE